jgi:DNA-binding NarL/FixJ family response regulator
MTGLPSRRSDMPVRLVLADDHVVVRQALSLFLASAGFQVVGQASNGHEAVALVRDRAPDVAVLDVVMPLLSGLDAAREIQHASPRTSVILLTSRHDEQLMLEAVQAGIRGCVQKTHEAKELIRAIREVAAGGVHLSAAFSRCVVEAYRTKTSQPPDPLSPRERQVLQLIAEGNQTRDIAQLLGVRVKTAESHRANIRRKLGIRQPDDLVRYALQSGSLPVQPQGLCSPSRSSGNPLSDIPRGPDCRERRRA